MHSYMTKGVSDLSERTLERINNFVKEMVLENARTITSDYNRILK